jgi:predicted nucleic acid-binding protein
LIQTNTQTIIISTQDINEVCVNLFRKTSLQEADILALIEDFENRCSVLELSSTTLKNASGLRAQYNLSFWDSMIVASAMQAGAEVLYSEDMQAGLIISNQLEIVNPFQ